MRKKLSEFADASANYEVSAIYTTGHGVESNGTVYLIPGDFPVQQGNSALPGHALPLSEIAQASRAKKVNLIFYGGCRDDPLAN